MKAFYEEDKRSAVKMFVETKKLFRECDLLIEKNKDVYCVKLVEYLKKMIDAVRTILRCIIDYESIKTA